MPILGEYAAKPPTGTVFTSRLIGCVGKKGVEKDSVKRIQS